MIQLRPALLTAALFLAACDTSTQTSSLSTTTDSSGVAIVVGPAADSALPWTLTEVRRIGGADTGVASFTRVSPGLVATDERATIAVLDWSSTNRIQVFDSSGNWLRSVGAKGGGPGEIQAPAGLAMDRDGRLLVFDFRKMALIHWAPDGAPGGETAWGTQPGYPTGVARMLGDTTLLLLVDEDSLKRVLRLEMRTPGGAVAVDSLVGPAPKVVRLSCIGMGLPPLFTGELVWGLGAGRLLTSRQTEYVVQVHEKGRLVRSVRRAITPRPSVATDAERLYPGGMTIRFGEGQECVVPNAELIEKVGIAPNFPVVKAVTMSPDGTLWVQRYTVGDETPSTDVFDASGGYLGTFVGKSIPLGFLANDLVLFPIENADDGTSIIGIYRIGRP